MGLREFGTPVKFLLLVNIANGICSNATHPRLILVAALLQNFQGPKALEWCHCGTLGDPIYQGIQEGCRIFLTSLSKEGLLHVCLIHQLNIFNHDHRPKISYSYKISCFTISF